MNDHQWLDSVAAYALDALDPDDRTEFEGHLATCAICQREVDEMQNVAGLLAHAADDVAPPPALRDRIMRAARDQRSPRPRSRHSLWRTVPWLAAAAGLAIAAVQTTRYRREHADGVLAEAENARLRLDVSARDSLLSAVLAPGVQTIEMRATGQPPAARLYYNRVTRELLLAAYSLPPASPGRTYQLWGLVPGRDPVSLGVFNTDQQGRARVLLQVPAGSSVAQSAVTEEPAGGSPAPTTTPFLVASWATTG